ncbi:hypothetical protein V1512DRAFT_206740 [Lipomyces arxii]|uniref:uncharacterized protein n=1 Tax=Lipomyces arxii TaxID=56418 RepID=UPI0034CD42D7
MSEIINANPTILSLADLPTRSAGEGITESKLAVPRSALDVVSHIDDAYSSLLLAAVNDDDTEREDVPELSSGESETSDDDTERIDEQEIYDLIATISDPEHPVTLGQLAVVNKQDIHIIPPKRMSKNRHSQMTKVVIEITPTITHCSLATLIGLGIRVRLERCLPPRFRIEINVKKGTHQSESQVNKQLNDKERVAAACENQQLLGVVSTMLASCK